MKKQQFAWILGGAWFVGMGVVASMSACSDDDNTVKDSGTKDQTSGDTGNKDVVTTDQNSGDSNPPQDGGADCKTVPEAAPFTTLDSGPFCPFQGDGSTFASCTNAEHCCLPCSGAGCGSSVCTPNGTACVFAKDAATNSDFQCNESNDCPVGNV